MFDGVKGQFVKAMGDGVDPKTIPVHIVAYYDDAVRMFTKFGHYTGIEDVPHNLWPLICLLADLQDQIKKLEAKQVQTATAHDLSYVVDEQDDSTVQKKVHWKTRQAEERRAALVGA